MQQPRVYLAGPDVFLRDSVARGEELKAFLREVGLTGVFPLDGELSSEGVPGPELGHEIYRQNDRLVRSCDAVLANLTPFRGPSADVGTVFEVGLACGLGLLVVGYTTAEALFEERTRRWAEEHGAGLRARGDGSLEDGDGLQVESFGLTDNLMIDGAIRASGGVIVSGGADPARRAAEELAARLRPHGTL